MFTSATMHPALLVTYEFSHLIHPCQLLKQGTYKTSTSLRNFQFVISCTLRQLPSATRKLRKLYKLINRVTEDIELLSKTKFHERKLKLNFWTIRRTAFKSNTVKYKHDKNNT